MANRTHFEVIIVGGGIAGASLSYFLTERGVCDVLLLEREAYPGYHATGRSAAVLVEFDMVPTLSRLIVAAAPFLREPPPGFCDNPLLDRAGILAVFREPLWSAVRQLAPGLTDLGVRLELLSPAQTVDRVPYLLAEKIDGGILLPEDGHIDVHELLSNYLRHAKRHGVEQRFEVEVTGISRSGGRCTGVETSQGGLQARWVVNASGAWAAHLGEMAGAPIRLVPHRRTIVTFAAPDGVDVRHWPLVDSEADHIYFKPESGGLLLSPMDESPMGPCDAQPDDVAIAEGLAHLANLAPRLVPRTLKRKWAGLRTFAPDRVPVVGEDPRLPGFFWLAGQGGCGIETSPIMGQIAADLIVFGRTERFDAQLLTPSRFLQT